MPTGAVAATAVNGKNIIQFGAIHYDGIWGEVGFRVLFENERTMRWLWRHEIQAQLPKEVEQRMNEVLIKHYQDQAADPVRQHLPEVYPVKDISRCQLLKEPFVQSGKREHYYEVKWEGDWGKECVEPEGTLRHCGHEVEKVIKDKKREL